MSIAFATNTPPPYLLADNHITRSIRGAARHWNIPEEIALSLAWREREPTLPGLQANIRGKDGEYGLFQIMPATARELGVTGPLTILLKARVNSYYGMKHLRAMLTKFGPMPDALSAYNAGSPWRVNNRSYVNDILVTARGIRRAEVWGTARNVATVAGLAMIGYVAYKELAG